MNQIIILILLALIFVPYRIQLFSFAFTIWYWLFWIWVRPSNPTTCTHLWIAPIPTQLETGMHTIEVKATDIFGRTHIQKSQYQIVKAKENN